MGVSSGAPPHGLQLVIDFVNTLDIEEATDELSSPPALGRWLTDRGLLPAGVGENLGADALHDGIELREALRGALLAHNDDDPGDPGAAGRLDAAAARGRLSIRFTPAGAIEIVARETGFPGALAQLLAPAARAAADGSWERVKACAADDCRWAFYDRSRNRSGRWCNMGKCGNRTKVRAYRSKRGA